jgi:hypothetical protein
MIACKNSILRIEIRRGQWKNQKDKLLEQTKQFWQTCAQKALSDEDAKQIIKNVTGFLKVLNSLSNSIDPVIPNTNCWSGAGGVGAF